MIRTDLAIEAVNAVCLEVMTKFGIRQMAALGYALCMNVKIV